MEDAEVAWAAYFTEAVELFRGNCDGNSREAVLADYYTLLGRKFKGER